MSMQRRRGEDPESWWDRAGKAVILGEVDEWGRAWPEDDWAEWAEMHRGADLVLEIEAARAIAEQDAGRGR